MVTGLQLPLTDFFPAEPAAKSHSRESETVDGLTFGGILQAKEKQLQDAQTVSASSIVAAVAALQAVPVAKLVSETTASQILTETRAVESSESGEKTQAEMASDAFPDGQFDTHVERVAVEPVIIGMPANPNPQPAEALADSPDKIVDRKPGNLAGQSPSGKEIPALEPVQPEAQATPEKMEARSKAASALSKPMEAQAAFSFPQAALGTGDGESARTVRSAGLEGQESAPQVYAAESKPLHQQVAQVQSIVPEPLAEQHPHAVEAPVVAHVPPPVSPLQGLPEAGRGQIVAAAENPPMPVKQSSDQAVPLAEGLPPEKARVAPEAPASAAFATNFEHVKPGMQPVALTEAAEGQVELDPPVSDGSQLEAGAVQRTTQGSPTSRVAQAAESLQGTVPASGESATKEGAAGSRFHTVETSPRQEARNVTSATSRANLTPEPANLQGRADSADKPAAPVQFAWQGAAQPVVTSQEPVKETGRASGVRDSAALAGETIKPAEKWPETKPGMEVAASQTPQARGNFVESVAGTGTGIETKFPAAEVIRQIVHHVEARVQDRSTEMHLQLNPKELGVIDVQMVSGPQGVSVTFSAEQPATGRLLEAQLSQLHQSLAEAGVQIAGLNIGQHGQPRQEGGFLNHTPQFTHLPPRDDPPKGANVQEPRRPLQGSGRPGEVDYLI